MSDLASESRVRAEQGDVKAEEKLASLYYYGRGVPQDYTEAIHWYRRAAEQDYAKDQLILGDIYYLGKAYRRIWPKLLIGTEKPPNRATP